MSESPAMKTPPTPPAWSTLDQIKYLQSAVYRDGQLAGRDGGPVVDARRILETCIKHCWARKWSGGVNVAVVEREARLLLESLE